MKKLIATVCFFVAFGTVQAQDTTLNEYVGKYTYLPGSFITSSEIILENGTLKAISDQGSATLDKRGKDTFALREHEGMVYFFRNAAGKVARVKAMIGDLLLEGTKDGVTAWLQRPLYFAIRKQPLTAQP